MQNQPLLGKWLTAWRAAVDSVHLPALALWHRTVWCKGLVEARWLKDASLMRHDVFRLTCQCEARANTFSEVCEWASLTYTKGWPDLPICFLQHTFKRCKTIANHVNSAAHVGLIYFRGLTVLSPCILSWVLTALIQLNWFYVVEIQKHGISLSRFIHRGEPLAEMHVE